MAAGAFLAANVLAAYLSAQGRGLDVVLVELVVVAVLVAVAVARPLSASWTPALAAVCVIVVIPFALPLPTLEVGPRTAVAGAVQFLAVVVVARYYEGVRRQVDQVTVTVFEPLPARPTPTLAWPVAVLAGIGLGLVAHALVHSGLAGGNRVLPDLWRMSPGGQVTELLGVIVIGVVVEETLFRELLAPLSRAALGRWSILFDGALYATLYGGSRSVGWCLVVAAAGALAAWYRLRYGRLGPVVVAHVLASALALVILRLKRPAHGGLERGAASVRSALLAPAGMPDSRPFQPPRDALRDKRLAPPWLAFLVPTAAGVVGVWTLDGANAAASNAYGLISVLPVISLVAMAVLTVSFVVVVARTPQRAGLLYVHVLTVVVLLYGAAPLSEHEGRLPTSFYIVGNINHIASTGQLLLHTDARWSWPGMFSGVAALLAPAGLSSALPLLLWAPVVFMLAYSLPLLAIGRALAPPRVGWIGLWLFYLADWTGQEYFSPQAVALFFFLAIVAVTLTYLRTTDGHQRAFAASRLARAAGRLRHAARSEPVGAPATKWQEAGLIGIWTVAVAALTVSHQLTPVALVFDLLALAALGRLRHKELALLALALLVVFISYLTTDFWLGHFRVLIGVGGGGSGAISANVGNHLVGNRAHRAVLDLRIGFTGAFWAAGAIGVLRLALRRQLMVSVVVLAWLPLVIPLIQPYGGEALIRAFLLGLPFMALLAAFAVLPSGRAGRWTWIGLGLALVLLIPVFFVNRYGNEEFEATRPGELAAVRYLYAHAPAGSTLMVASEVVPWQYTQLTTYNYATVSSTSSLPDVSDVLQSVRNDGSPDTYLLFSTEQQDAAILDLGAPAGWLDALGANLVAGGHFRPLLHNQDALVLAYTSRAGTRRG